MMEFDLYDFLGHHGYRAQAWKRHERASHYLKKNETWFSTLASPAATVLKELGAQFAQGGTEALESRALWEVPEIKAAGGLDALKSVARPADVMIEAKGRLFGP